MKRTGLFNPEKLHAQFDASQRRCGCALCSKVYHEKQPNKIQQECPISEIKVQPSRPLPSRFACTRTHNNCKQFSVSLCIRAGAYVTLVAISISHACAAFPKKFQTDCLFTGSSSPARSLLPTNTIPAGCILWAGGRADHAHPAQHTIR